MNSHVDVTPMDFGDAAPVEIPFSMRGRKFVLREPSEDAAARFRNANAKAAKLTDGKVSGIDGIADSTSLLVALCTFEVHSDGRVSETSVTQSTVRGWNARHVKKLFDKAKAMGELSELDTVESIDKQIDELKQQRDRLVEEKSGPKPAPTGGATT